MSCVKCKYVYINFEEIGRVLWSFFIRAEAVITDNLQLSDIYEIISSALKYILG